ncbi:MAG: DUF1638 domain-containing protein, partial [Coriobacteriia bacterium]|nr:DUF1638 domain-containing protein [Coriobacteriia bacterium]
MPEKLNAWLCDFIPRLENVDYLLLPMGLCGNSTAGIPSGNTTLVLPKSEDCISLLLSTERLADVDRPRYNYFFTDSWLDYERSFAKEFDLSIQKYGKKTAENLMQMIYKNYKYFSYIDTGYGDFESAAASVAELAKLVDVEVNRLEGSFGVLRKMLKLEFDDDFLLIPPGQTVEFAITELR